MIELGYPKDNLIVLGQSLKIIRTSKNYSVRGVADATNISVALVSDIENGKKIANLVTLQSLYQALDIDLLIDETTLNTYFQEMMSFYNAMYHKNWYDINAIYQKIMQASSRLMNSPLMVELKLLESTYLGSLEKRFDAASLEQLTHWYDAMSVPQKQRCNIIIALSHLVNDTPYDAIRVLKKNLSLNANQKAHAITLEYLARASSMTFQDYNVIKFGAMASKLHAYNNSVYRKIASDLILVKGYTSLKDFDEANTLLSSIDYLIKNDKQYHSFKNQYYLYKAYLESKQALYDQALETIENVSDNSHFVWLTKVYLACKLKENDTIRILIESMLKNVNIEPLFFHLAVILDALINASSKPIKQSVDYLMNHTEKLYTYDFLKFTYGLLSELCYQNNDIDGLHAINKKLLMIEDLRKS